HSGVSMRPRENETPSPALNVCVLPSLSSTLTRSSPPPPSPNSNINPQSGLRGGRPYGSPPLLRTTGRLGRTGSSPSPAAVGGACGGGPGGGEIGRASC